MTAGTVHGGPDALGVPRWDFSTNSNACGPCPTALAALRAAPHETYPDPGYHALRERLAAWHGVPVARVLLAGSASEFMQRLSAALAQAGARSAWWPEPGYGDYARAAAAWGLARAATPSQAPLLWCCEPSSPLGQADAVLARAPALGPERVLVLDCAYAPLRLRGQPTWAEPNALPLWQLWSPNKALGLTGVRAAYVLAPPEAPTQQAALVARLAALAPSWPLGADGVALLQAWTEPATQAWLAQCRPTLRAWAERQLALCRGLGWDCRPGDANFFVARPALPQAAGPCPEPMAGHPSGQACPLSDRLAALRARHGIKLRDATSFGLPGWVRLGVLAPAAQDALARAWAECNAPPLTPLVPLEDHTP